MTTYYNMKIQCSICGTEDVFDGIRSTNEQYSPDLDMRPAPMRRFTIFAWVQRCAKCGYCASPISRDCPEARSVVNSQGYKDQLNDLTYSKLANSFLCKAIIEKELKDFSEATWSFLLAAWVCDDDSKYTEQAIICRKKAADMLVLAEENCQQLEGDEDTSTAILVDSLRRSGQTEKAIKIINERRSGITNDIVAKALDFQIILIEKNDLTCHTIDEAIREWE